MSPQQNPFDDLVRPGPKQSEIPENPFDDLTGFKPVSVIVGRQEPQEEHVFGEFAAGVATGLLSPTNIVSGKEAAFGSPDTVPEHVSHFLGSLLGLGISWYPIARGATWTLRGIGLTKVLSDDVFKAVAGATAFGLYEAASETELKDTPESFVRGLGIGLALEGVLMGAAMRGRKAIPPTLDGATSEGVKVKVSADALAIEQALDVGGERTLDELTTKLADLGPAEMQLDDVMARVLQLYRPGGWGIIPKVVDPKSLVESVKRISPKVESVFSRGKDGLYEVMLFDPEVDGKLIRLAKNAAAQKKTIWEYLGSGQKRMTREEVVELITRPDVPGELRPAPTLSVGTRMTFGDLFADMEGTLATYLHGSFIGEGAPGHIAMLDPGLAEGKDFLSIIAHEYTHHVTGGSRSIFDVFASGRGAAMWKRLIGGDNPVIPMNEEWLKATKPDEQLPRIFEEFKAAEIVSLALKSRVSETYAAQYVKSRWAAYYSDSPEMMAHLIELMSLDPLRAKQIAPNAVKLMTELIKETSPKLQSMLSRGRELGAFDDLMNIRWSEQIGEGRLFFKEVPTKFNRVKAAREFSSSGFVSGMAVEYGGKLYEAVGGNWRAAEGKVKLFDPMTKHTFAAPADQVTRPLLPRMAEASEAVRAKLTRLLNLQEDWLGFNIPVADGIQRGIVDLTNFARARSVLEYAHANKEAVFKGRKPHEIPNLKEAVFEQLREANVPGLIIEEAGVPLEVHILDQAKIQFGEKLSMAWGKTVDQAVVRGSEEAGFLVDSFEPSFRNRVESLLRASGVDNREIDYYVGFVEREFAQKIKGVLGDDFRVLWEFSSQEAARAEGLQFNRIPSFPPEEAAARVGLKIDRTVNGQIRVLAPDGLELGRFAKESDASRFLSRIGRPLARDLDEGVAIPTASGQAHAAPQGTPPPPPQGQLPLADPADLTKTRRAFESLSLALARVTPIRSLAQAIENLGLGRAWSVVFQESQKALREVDRILGQVPRPKLNGQTLRQAAENMSRKLAGLAPERRHLVTRSIEFRTKEELEKAGGILGRPMSAEEIQLSNEIEKLGLADEIPSLAAKVARVQINVRGAAKEGRKLGLTGETLNGYLSEVRRRVTSAQGLTEDQQWVFDRIATLPDQQSLLAIARHAAAPRLDKTALNSQEMFFKLHEFNGKERRASQELGDIFTEMFYETGFNADQMIRGFWPVARQFIKEGFVVGGDSSSVSAKLFESTPEGVQWIGRRLKSGGLDPYELDPGLYVYQHGRNLLMSQFFDTKLPEWLKEISLIGKADERAGRLMAEYINELVGVPHQQFVRLQEILKTIAKGVGKEIPDDVAERYVNVMAKVAHQAAIPWRMALILRNYMQTLQFTVPIVGPEMWIRGLRKAITQEGFLESVRAGAIDVNVVPVFAPEVLSKSGRIAEKLGPTVNKLAGNWESLMNRGFDWYRHADDIGRSIAFHAGKERVLSNLGRFMRESVGDYERALERFKVDGKVKTFNEVVEKEFERLVRAGETEEAANLIGTQLAEKAHFLYGHANHPAGWNGVYGRLFGQFGTFPTQYVQTLAEGITRGTFKDRAEFVIGHVGINVGIVGAGAAIGLDLGSWSTLPSIHYSGGPYADAVLNLVNFWSGTSQERAVATENMKYMFPWFGSPQSIFVPGSYFIGDLWDAVEAKPGEALGEALGFRFMRPNDANWLAKALGWAY